MSSNDQGRATRRDLRVIIGEGALFSVMVGLGETYFSAFGLALGTGEVSAGLLTTVPLVMGAVLQLCSPWAIERLGSHRRWVVLCASTQAAVYLPLAWCAMVGQVPTSVVFGLIALYWGAGLASGPAWNTWIGRIVPVSIRARYFAQRTRVGQLATLSGFLVAGFALQAGAAWGRSLWVFTAMFLLAGVCRLSSAMCLASQSELPPGTIEDRRLNWREVWAKFHGTAAGRRLVYLLAVQAAVQISGPFFTPYMLKQLQFSYLEYVTLVSCAYLAKVAALPWHGRLAQRYGARRLLWVGGLGIVPVAGLWVFSDEFGYLMAVQILSGTVWAAYELAMFLLTFDSIDETERTSLLTAHNLLHALATMSGSLLGGLLISLGGRVPTAYLTVFGLSSLARFGALALLVRIPDPRREAEPDSSDEEEADLVRRPRLYPVGLGRGDDDEGQRKRAA